MEWIISINDVLCLIFLQYVVVHFVTTLLVSSVDI